MYVCGFGLSITKTKYAFKNKLLIQKNYIHIDNRIVFDLFRKSQNSSIPLHFVEIKFKINLSKFENIPFVNYRVTAFFEHSHTVTSSRLNRSRSPITIVMLEPAIVGPIKNVLS